jgi:hypothetical protein
MTHLMLSVAIPEPTGITRMVVAGSGTLLMGTRIFTTVSPEAGQRIRNALEV